MGLSQAGRRANGYIANASTTFDPSNLGRGTAYFTDLMAHELGHTFGLGDTTAANFKNYSTTYNPASASGPSQCDKNAVVKNYHPVSGGGNGGPGYGGCTGTCGPNNLQCEDSYAVCNSQTCLWQCANGEPGCEGEEPEPCCDDCHEECEAGGWTCIGSPITIDAFGKGFHFMDTAGGVKFRVLPFGNLHQMSWPDAEFKNGWLALDRDGDGKITSFRELFGVNTAQPPSANPNGYRALAVFDDPANGGNGNGVIDSGDSVYNHLLLWIDDNHNGISEPNELHGLAEMGVFTIDLHYETSHYVDSNGNVFRYKSNVSDRARTTDPVCYDVFVTMR